MVVMRNLRLPELDKNRNVEQQKALIFESETCKYDVTLGADFLTKTGIDVKYSTGTIQWFKNELPLSEPHTSPRPRVRLLIVVLLRSAIGRCGLIRLPGRNLRPLSYPPSPKNSTKIPF